MILPTGAPSFAEALRYGSEVYHTLKVCHLIFLMADDYTFPISFAVMCACWLKRFRTVTLHLKRELFMDVGFVIFAQGVIKEKYGLDATNVGDEGGFAPAISR